MEKEKAMFKKILITAILLGLLTAGSLMAEERWTLDIYCHVHAASSSNLVEIGYLDINGTQHEINTYSVGGGYTLIHCQIQIWPDDPPADLVFAEGWGGGYHDYDECDATLYYPMELDLYLGVVPEDPTTPQEQ